jgi:hypothetical protein
MGVSVRVQVEGIVRKPLMLQNLNYLRLSESQTIRFTISFHESHESIPFLWALHDKCGFNCCK